MQITHDVFETRLPREVSWDGEFFQFCEFRRFQDEGTHITSIFVDCAFIQCDFYMVLANIASFVGVRFVGCVFQGCAFSSCRFIECRFEDCHFGVSNLDASCSFDGSRWYGCIQDNTEGLNKAFAAHGGE